MVMPALLLQKSSAKSMSRDNTEVQKRGLHSGKKVQLLKEAETTQKRLKSGSPSQEISEISKKLSNLMNSGKMNVAVKLRTAKMQGTSSE